MTTEPDWIEHDGSAACPVPAGHDVEVRFGDGKRARDKFPGGWGWGWDGFEGPDGKRLIAAYRDWTAFEQQAAGKDDVPDWAFKRVQDLSAPLSDDPDFEINERFATVRAFARYIAAHEPAPVDPLRQIADEVRDAWVKAPNGTGLGNLVCDILRARGVTTNTAPVADERN